ncbi:hypothetical protein B0T16DRAFT_458935 [Cercophora newfieldiana]|uniref:C2H2-type domain-containing protein n=1 Tax=Cercophora newfieldiana TaxID=92897 RepID=A0AA39Y6Q9_9PEZI|nr:hypothetical protein B0T16DRAFT_458935 [Cercophora newfieldiana]
MTQGTVQDNRGSWLWLRPRVFVLGVAVGLIVFIALLLLIFLIFLIFLAMINMDPDYAVWSIITLETHPQVNAAKRKADDVGSNDKGVSDDPKRVKLADYTRQCVRCNKKFQESEDAPNDCFYHPGEVEANMGHEFWGEMDDYMESEDMKDFWEDCPAAFWFSCCYQDGTTKGCKQGRHQAVDDEQGQMGLLGTKETIADNKTAVVEISDEEDGGSTGNKPK